MGQLADEVRDRLAALGVQLQDGADGTTWTLDLKAGRMRRCRDVWLARNAVREALLGRRAATSPGRCWRRACTNVAPSTRSCALSRERSVPVRARDAPGAGSPRRRVEPQGVVAASSPYPYADLDDMLALPLSGTKPPFLLALDSLQDPQNVGSLLRTAEAVGVHGVILPERRAVQASRRR